jgi:hypothetical protein
LQPFILISHVSNYSNSPNLTKLYMAAHCYCRQAGVTLSLTCSANRSLKMLCLKNQIK